MIHFFTSVMRFICTVQLNRMALLGSKISCFFIQNIYLLNTGAAYE